MTDRAPGVAIARARTLLFVPAARPERFDRALAAGADLVVVDLEASVRPIDKEAARSALAAWMPACTSPERVLVRVNPATSEWFAADIAALHAIGAGGIVLPMAESAKAVAEAIGAAPRGIPAIALIETAAGILEAPHIAAVSTVTRLAFGNMDYAADTGTRGRDSTIFASAQLVLASRANRLAPPIAGVTAAFQDAARLAEDAAWERAQGFGGKFCIHPDQVPIVARAFSATAEELAWARRVVEAAGSSFACVVDGEMVDRPVVERARRILDDSEG